MKRYRMHRTPEGVLAEVDGEKVPWFAMLADCLGDEIALDCCYDFEEEVIGHIAMRDWTLPESVIRIWHEQRQSRIRHEQSHRGRP